MNIQHGHGGCFQRRRKGWWIEMPIFNSVPREPSKDGAKMDATIHFMADLAARNCIEVLVEDEYQITCNCLEGVDEREEANGIAASVDCGRLSKSRPHTAILWIFFDWYPRIMVANVVCGYGPESIRERGQTSNQEMCAALRAVTTHFGGSSD